jgi:hypothetical protein
MRVFHVPELYRFSTSSQVHKAFHESKGNRAILSVSYILGVCPLDGPSSVLAAARGVRLYRSLTIAGSSPSTPLQQRLGCGTELRARALHEARTPFDGGPCILHGRVIAARDAIQLGAGTESSQPQGDATLFAASREPRTLLHEYRAPICRPSGNLGDTSPRHPRQPFSAPRYPLYGSRVSEQDAGNNLESLAATNLTTPT